MSRAEQFALLEPEVEARWRRFSSGDRVLFPQLLGLIIDEVRADYCRMTMPHRPDLDQAAGLVHGGAIASLLDTVVVPAVGSAYGREARYSTIDMHVQFMSAAVREDVTAEGWVVRRGRSVVFCESEAVSAVSGKVIARSVLTYNVSAGS